MALPSWSLSQVAFAFFPLHNSCMRAVISCFSGCDASTCLCVTYLLVLSTHVKDSAVLWAAVPLSITGPSLLLNFRDMHLVLLEPCCKSGTFPTHTAFTLSSQLLILWFLSFHGYYEKYLPLPLHTLSLCVPSSLIWVSYSLFLHGPFLS